MISLTPAYRHHNINSLLVLCYLWYCDSTWCPWYLLVTECMAAVKCDGTREVIHADRASHTTRPVVRQIFWLCVEVLIFGEGTGYFFVVVRHLSSPSQATTHGHGRGRHAVHVINLIISRGSTGRSGKQSQRDGSTSSPRSSSTHVPIWHGRHVHGDDEDKTNQRVDDAELQLEGKRCTKHSFCNMWLCMCRPTPKHIFWKRNS